MTPGRPRSKRVDRNVVPLSVADADAGRFWAIAEPFLELPDVTRSTMMGLPCLRVDGAFFASWDRRTEALLVKLAETTVNELVTDGRAEPFAPAGRRFREWAAIPASRSRSWRRRLQQAHQHVAS